LLSLSTTSIFKIVKSSGFTPLDNFNVPCIVAVNLSKTIGSFIILVVPLTIETFITFFDR